MSKKSDFWGWFLTVLVIVLLLLPILVPAWVIWYDVIDTGNLVFYKEEYGAFENIYACSNQLYITLDSKQLYFSGYNGCNRVYRNAKGVLNERLGIRQPYLIFDGRVKKLIPYYTNCLLIIDESDSLYLYFGDETTKLADNVIDADGQEMYDRQIYYIDASYQLHYYKDGVDKVLADGIKRVDVCLEKIYCITTDNTLVESELVENQDISFKPLMENVVDVSASDFVWYERLDDGGDEPQVNKYYYPLINALTDNGDLYVLGRYQAKLNYDATGIEPFKVFDEWTLISKNVVAFNTTEYGTIYLTDKGESYYHGCDFVYTSDVSFIHKKLIDDSTGIDSSTSMLIIETNEGWYFFGNIYGVRDETNDSIATGTPIFWSKDDLN